MTLREFADETGMDLEGTMARFANMESLVKKFLKKFPADPSFAELSKAMEEGDAAGVERSAHTLKGVAGNLGFQELFDVNQQIVDAVRSGHSESLSLYFEKDRELYEKIILALKKLD